MRLLDQVRERIRYKHYSIRSEESYVHWVRGFIRFHQLKHPKDMGSAEVTAFLSWLAAERGASHAQAGVVGTVVSVLRGGTPVYRSARADGTARLFALWHGSSFDGGAAPAGQGC